MFCRMLGALFLLVMLATPAAAQEPLRSTELRQRLESLLTRYTSEHPDVIYTQRLLEKAEALEAEKRKARELRRAQRQREMKQSDQKPEQDIPPLTE